MTFVYPDRVSEISTTVGDQGDIILQGAEPSYWTFASRMGIGDETIVARDDGLTSELLRVRLVAADRLQVLAVYDSSNGGARVVWPAGQQRVYPTLLGRYALLPPTSDAAGRPVVVQPDGSYGAGSVAVPAPTGLALATQRDVTQDATLIVTLLVSWSAVAAPGVTYEVLVRSGQTSGWPGNASTGTTYSAGGGLGYRLPVVPGYTYGVSVRARTAAGVSAWSDESAIAAAGDTSAPNPPTGIQAQVGFQTIFLSWINDTAPDLDRVEWWQAATNNAAAAVYMQDAKGSAVVLSGFASGVSRWLFARSVDVSGNRGAFSAGVQVTPGALDLSAFPSDLRPIQDVATLPSGAPSGGVTTLRYQGRLYTWDGARWADIASAGNLTGQIGSDQLSNSAVTLAKFAAGITPVEILGALPATANFEGRQAFVAGKAYRYTGGQWVTGVPAADVQGQLQAAQIAAVNAAVVTGQLSPDQIASLPAGKVTGQLSSDQIASLQAAKLAGQIVGTQITDGAVTAEKIFAAAVTTDKLAAGAVVAGKIAAGAVTAEKLAAGSVVAGKLAADAVTAGTIAANAVTARELQAGSVTAGKLAAGAVTAGTIAAGSVTASNLVLADPSNLLLNPDFQGGSLDGWVVQDAWISEAPDNANDPLTGGRWRVQGHARIPLTWGRSFPVTAGEAYYVSGWIFNTAPERAGLMLSFADSNGGNGFGFALGGYTDVKSQWTFVEGIVPVPATALRMFFMCVVEHNGSASPTFWGRLTLRRATGASLLVQGSVTTDKLAADSVVAGKVAAAAINTRELAAGAVTADTMAAGAVVAGKLAANAVVAGNIAAEAVQAGAIAAGAVTTDKLAANAVTANKVAAGQIQATHLAAGSITASKLAVVPNNLVADPFIQDDAYWSAQGPGYLPLDGTHPIVAGMGVPRAFHVNYASMQGQRLSYLQRSIPVDPGTEYVLEIAAAADTMRPWADVLQYSPSGAGLGAASYTRSDGVVQGATGTLLTGRNRLSFVTPPTCSTVLLRFGADALNVASGFVILSAVKLTRKTDGALLVDGSVTTRHMTAGSINADRLAAGSITGNLIAAETVRASSILVGTANNVAPDPACRDPLVWFNSTQGVPAPGDGINYAPQTWWRTEGYVYLAATGGPKDYFTKFFPVRPGSKYRVRWSVYIHSDWQGKASFLLHQPAVAWNLLGAPNAGTWAGYGVPYQFTGSNLPKDQLVTFEAVVDNVDGQWGTRWQFRLLHETTAGTLEIGGIEVVPMSGTTLIEDGGITTDKLAAGSVVAGKIAANAVTAGTIAANAVQAGNLAAGSVTAEKLSTGTLITDSAQLGTATVKTITIEGNAVTVPTTGYDGNTYTMTSAWVPVGNTPIIDSVGQPILFIASCMNILYGVTYPSGRVGVPMLEFRLMRAYYDFNSQQWGWVDLTPPLGGQISDTDVGGGSLISGISKPWCFSIVDNTQGAGRFSYQLWARRADNGMSPFGCQVAYVSTTAIEVKR
ncbi:hypothetical protein [Azospirillum thermophilum]|uniref:hypothetical protein n=1 Tax=Azospirillum thermophilum TaxID=2202148 RepID=UPI0015E8B192|nr:hypothetical protein [Azospirillum thermophilum]